MCVKRSCAALDVVSPATCAALDTGIATRRYVHSFTETWKKRKNNSLYAQILTADNTTLKQNKSLWTWTYGVSIRHGLYITLIGKYLILSYSKRIMQLWKMERFLQYFWGTMETWLSTFTVGQRVYPFRNDVWRCQECVRKEMKRDSCWLTRPCRYHWLPWPEWYVECSKHAASATYKTSV